VPKLKRHYLVVECSTCKRFLLAASDKKTRTCPYCGKRVLIEEARVAAQSESAEKARLALQELKIKEHHDKSTIAGPER
jgi:DNA-directed RNA polymerase subunit RPC12/RpoP